MRYKILILVGWWDVLAHAKLTAIVPGHCHVIDWSHHEIKADNFIYYYFNGKLLFIEAIQSQQLKMDKNPINSHWQNEAPAYTLIAISI